MKPTGMFTLAVSGCLGIALATMAFTNFRAATHLRRANQALESDLAAARSQASSLAADKHEANRLLATVLNRHAELTARVAELESDATDALAAATSNPAIKPYRAEAYIGRQPLGLVWIVPRNLRLDTNSQRYVYEPVVCLDDKLRRFFEIHHTNIVEQVTETPVYVNNSYYPEPYYYYPGYYYPARPTNGVPPQAQPYSGPPPFDPGNGTIIKQPLGTPAESIKTYQTIPQLPVNPTPGPPVVPPPIPRPPSVRPPLPRAPASPGTPNMPKPSATPASGFRAVSL